MNNPWIGIPVLTFLAAAVLAALYGLYRLCDAIRYEARSAQHTAAGVRAAREAETYTGQLHAPAPPWDAAPGPSQPAARRLELLPPDPPEPPPADTGEISISASVLGIPPDNSEYVEQTFAKYPPEMIP